MGVELNIKAWWVGTKDSMKREGVGALPGRMVGLLKDTKSFYYDEPHVGIMDFGYKVGKGRRGKTALVTGDGQLGKNFSMYESTLRYASKILSGELDGNFREAIEQAKQWKKVEEEILKLKDGESFAFLTPKRKNTEDGVAFTTVKRHGDGFEMTSRLLPSNIDNEAAMKLFKDLVKDKGELVLMGKNKGDLNALLVGIKGVEVDVRSADFDMAIGKAFRMKEGGRVSEKTFERETLHIFFDERFDKRLVLRNQLKTENERSGKTIVFESADNLKRAKDGFSKIEVISQVVKEVRAQGAASGSGGIVSKVRVKGFQVVVGETGGEVFFGKEALEEVMTDLPIAGAGYENISKLPGCSATRADRFGADRFIAGVKATTSVGTKSELRTFEVGAGGVIANEGSKQVNKKDLKMVKDKGVEDASKTNLAIEKETSELTVALPTKDEDRGECSDSEVEGDEGRTAKADKEKFMEAGFMAEQEESPPELLVNRSDMIEQGTEEVLDGTFFVEAMRDDGESVNSNEGSCLIVEGEVGCVGASDVVFDFAKFRVDGVPIIGEVVIPPLISIGVRKIPGSINKKIVFDQLWKEEIGANMGLDLSYASGQPIFSYTLLVPGIIGMLNEFLLL